MSLNATVARVTDRIVDRSAPLRRPYLDRMARARDAGPSRAHLTCGNQAHAYAAMPDGRQGGARRAAAPATSASSPPTTTCSRRISPTSATPS